MATKVKRAMTKRTQTEKRKRDQYMQRQIAAAIKWATKELAKVKKQGLLPNESADHILAEVGRRWNIGAMSAVEKKLNLHPTQPDDEEEDEEVDEDGETVEL